ncbi:MULTISPECIES: ACP phosphodiesterase [unclassified Shewanella]|uniref:acyl carrier protein phosphodiesterase n=1 Tax=unclassified Shewanella TaxID=196818 RepID=UPI000C82DBF0|nr:MULTISPECIES: ACP phosphodiesterase [unclassified Shewanella]MDO6619526.1 ACP phosphodiesterase [Shewanella sp. 6_MG-2023]MDO6641244.1 ACP phosphodiesterase [Shewanella sp. 5_MG-2023]MDO6679442.1 ACP phosphodiesterase [Shewanella sp. 4_MG-2023]MDO6775821.1 ACP phosphodiesterase [Shewanella sp. 3_MG-2023]PMG29824.1 ACP phosphodiesterase [Shewanella sp. 10N.286.52.C2]
MNFLAHLHLADISDSHLAANLAGDFAKGDIKHFPKHLQQGLWLHRQIDQITDSHELITDLIKLFPKSSRRVAPILIDLVFDHYLAFYWDEYHQQSLSEFTQKAYHSLQHTAELPEKLQLIIPKVIEQDWLMSYQTRAGLNKAIEGVSQRISKPELFKTAISDVDKLYVEIEIAFRTFYPQLMAYSRIYSRKTPEQYLP